MYTPLSTRHITLHSTQATPDHNKVIGSHPLQSTSVWHTFEDRPTLAWMSALSPREEIELPLFSPFLHIIHVFQLIHIHLFIFLLVVCLSAIPFISLRALQWTNTNGMQYMIWTVTTYITEIKQPYNQALFSSSSLCHNPALVCTMV